MMPAARLDGRRSEMSSLAASPGDFAPAPATPPGPAARRAADWWVDPWHAPRFPEGCTILVDTREQDPWFAGPDPRTGDLVPWAQRGTINAGDYSMLGHENEVVIERKSLAPASRRSLRSHAARRRRVRRGRSDRVMPPINEGLEKMPPARPTIEEWDPAPTEPGWYWRRWLAHPNHEPMMVWVAAHQCGAGGYGCLWHGPLTPPALPEPRSKP